MSLSNNVLSGSRRRELMWCFPLLAKPAFTRLKLGDQEWMRRFRTFIKAFNEFVEALDDNKLDRAKWTHMRTAWNELDIDS